MITKKNNTLLTVNVAFITLIFFIYVLSIGASIIIPFILAILLSFLIISIQWFYRSKGLYNYLALLASLITIGLVIFGVSQIVSNNINEIIDTAPEYQEKLTNIVSGIAKDYNIDQSFVSSQILEKLNIPVLISGTASILTSIVKNAGLIIFFTIFILLESTSFWKKISMITGGPKSSFFIIFDQIQGDIKSYFMIKTLVSLGVAFISLGIMYVFWIDFLLFWMFLIFLFNYIPNVGSIIAVFFPVVFSLIQFESFSLTIIFLLFMVGAQVFMGNIVEPRLMGNKLNLSPLVILISLIFWGTIWWPIGMLLSVPIMVMINIVLAHIEVTRPVAVLLSEKWVVKFQWMPENKKLSLKKMKKFLQK